MRPIVRACCLLSAMVLAGAAPTLGSDRVCTVADPTGTPLNVRAQPNGGILSTIDNGSSVRVLEERMVGQKLWLRIFADGREQGWVFGAYLDCAADAMKSAPMRPRTPPG
ncbi:SH3 domain-containing protein [Pararhizobium arenae]|uniref:SH3 domain-containing protein n=1 Tax=Pararhizobium arenae TaxID=1856850 RepID=UPI00094B6ACD|nr:SH3 domain-containing protein [Pararhizobium arenae]